MSTNNIETFDPNALKKRVQETIQASFGMMIPPEQFAKMVEEAVKEYFESPQLMELKETEYIINPDAQSWNQRTGTKLRPAFMVSPFKYMVWVEVHKIARATLDQYLKNKEVAIKKQVEQAFDAPSIEHVANMTTEVLAETMAKSQRAFALSQAFTLFRNNLSTMFNQAGAYDVANKIGQMYVPSPDELAKDV